MPSASTAHLTQVALDFAAIEGLVVAGTREMLAAFGHPVDLVEGTVPESPGPSVMSIIGLAATGLRGSLLLLGAREAVAGLVPPELFAKAPPELVLRDVLGEYANMLAGRVKNQLLSHGLAPLLSTPTTVLAEDLVVPASRSGMSAWHRFRGPGAELFVRLDVTFATGSKRWRSCRPATFRRSWCSTSTCPG